MKKSCFFGAIFFLTVAIGTGFYLYKKYFPQIKSYGKEKIIQLSMNEIYDKIDEVEESQFKDSLKVYFNNQIKILTENDFEDDMRQFGKMVDQIKFFIKDGVIDSVEFTALKNMAIKNERSEKN